MRPPHPPPFPQSENLHLPDGLNFFFTLHSRGRELVSRRAIVSAEKNVPDRKERNEILVPMLWKVAVMNAMALRACKENRRFPKLQSQIAVVLEIDQCPKPDERSLDEACAEGI